MAFISLSEKISVQLPPERVLIAAVVYECRQFLSVDRCCPYHVSFAIFFLPIYVQIFGFALASCLICALAVPAHPLSVATITEIGSDQSAVRSWQGSDLTADWSLPISVLVWVRSFIEPDLRI